MNFKQTIESFELIEKKAQLAQGQNKLTAAQASIFKSIISNYGYSSKAMLQGVSGSGKSTVIRALKKYCDANKIECVVTASTGKAASALGGVTIHSFMGLSMTENINAETSEDAFKLSQGEKDQHNPEILIIDECSMIGYSLLSLIKKRNFNYVLFVGDMNQLPPVKDKSVDWTHVGDNYYELNETLRTKDPKLAKVFEDFRLQKEGKLKKLDIFDYENGVNIVSFDYEELLKLDDKTDSCFVGYRNRLVEKMSDILASDNQTMFNLNVGVTVTAMKCNENFTKNESGYFVREFVSEQKYFNGEDVSIVPLTAITTLLVKNGFANYGKWRLKMSAKGILITDTSARVDFGDKETKSDKYWISFPQEEVLEYCTLSVIGNDTFSLVWDGSEEEFKGMNDFYFSELSPFLAKQRATIKYYKDPYGVDLSMLSPEVRSALKTMRKAEFFAWYDFSEDVSRRKKGWKNLLDAKKVVSARPCVSRTIHKAQGISVPSIIISDYSFYGASSDAQYVAVTRAKHGLILVKNTPKTLVRNEDG